MSRPRRGRRAGTPGTRSTILAAARTRFAESGYEATSLRGIAPQAGVDPATVHHYFRSEEALFAVCVEPPLETRAALQEVAAVPVEHRAEAVVRTALEMWDSPLRPGLTALLRGAVGSPARATILREVLTRRIVATVLADLPDRGDRGLRGSLVVSQLLGLMIARHLLEVEPLSTATRDEIVAVVAPTLQRYLTGPLDGTSAPPGP